MRKFAIKVLFPFFKEYKKLYVQLLLGALIYTIIGFSTSIYIQLLTDTVIVEKDISMLKILGVLMIIIIPIQFIISFYKDYYLLKIGQIIDGKLILEHIYSTLEGDMFSTNPNIGKVVSQINDSVKIRNFMTTISLNIVSNIFILIFSIIFMIYFYWKLALLLIVLVPVFLVVYYIFARINKIAEEKQIINASRFREIIISTLSNIRTIKLLNIEENSYIKIENVFIDFIRSSFKSAMNNLVLQQLNIVLSQIFTILLLWLGASFVIKGELSIGELFSFYFILNYVLTPIISLMASDVHIRGAIVSSERLLEDKNESKNFNMEYIKMDELNCQGDIMFKDLFFKYPNKNQLFENLNIIIKKNTITAIVGRSGEGKSTLSLLLLRFLEPEKGNIKIGNTNIDLFDIRSYRKKVSIISQDIEIFSGTIIDNIHFDSKKEVDLARINLILEKLDLLELIESFPNGYYENLGERGIKLSGGQKQRIAIARVMYINPSIIIFDEATSALDNYTVGLINDIIIDLKKEGKTIIVIAHRKESFINSDEIIIIDRGKIVGKGKHEELMNNNEFYKKIIS